MAVPAFKAQCAQPRGWVEIHRLETETHSDAEAFEVYDWSEHHDSGARVHSCRSRGDAVYFAVSHAAANNRRLPSAEVLEFPGRAS